MEPERWKRVEDLYHAVLDQDESARAAFLQQSCNGEESLRREVESLLYYALRADKFIETPALELAAESFANQDAAGRTMLGRRIGQYELVAKLGSGGMGEVYRGARADDQFQKQVAIKLIRQGYDTALIVRRFRNERQISRRPGTSQYRFSARWRHHPGRPSLLRDGTGGRPAHRSILRRAQLGYSRTSEALS